MIFLLEDKACGGLFPILRLVYNVINLLRIIIPIILILLGTIDLGKAVIASDDKEIKAAQSLLIKRLIYAAAIFFIPMLVVVIMNLVVNSSDDTKGGATEPGSDANSFKGCWNAIVSNKKDGSASDVSSENENGSIFA